MAAGIPFVLDLASIDGLNGFGIEGSSFRKLAGSSVASAGDDTLSSIENLVGSPFVDVLTSNVGAIALSGGAGNDRPTGDLGHDMLTGGADHDELVFNSINDNLVGAGIRNVITDSQVGLDDIDLFGIDANTSRAGDQGFKFIGMEAFGGKAGGLRYQTFDPAGIANDITVISGDINGDRVANSEIELTGIVKPTSGDFVL